MDFVHAQYLDKIKGCLLEKPQVRDFCAFDAALSTVYSQVQAYMKGWGNESRDGSRGRAAGLRNDKKTFLLPQERNQTR